MRKNNFNTILSFDYHPKLLQIFITFTPQGILAANILSPLLMSYVMRNFIPDIYIFIWLALHFIIYMGRLLVTKKLNAHLKSTNTSKYVKQTFILSGITTVLFSIAIWYSLLTAASDVHILTLTIIVVSLATGALATLISIYHLFSSYVILSLIPLIAMLIYHGGEMFNIFALILIVLGIVVLSAGHRQYNTLKSLILLEEEKEISNQKIEQLNQSLASKVADEVSKNREKDQLMLQQSRLAQMGEMLSMIAHQWRQPLAAISAVSATMKLKANANNLESTDIQQKAQNISDYSQHLSRTIDDFRDFFRPNKKKQKTTFDDITSSVLGIMEVQLENMNIKLIKELNCHKSFFTYPSEIKQVILNLISNAKEAIEESHIENPFIKIKTYSEGTQFILEVSDNAGGIPKEIQNNIFDPYFSTKKAKNGTGLGLYMSKMIIEGHCEGELSFSSLDEGTLFKILLNTSQEKDNE